MCYLVVFVIEFGLLSFGLLFGLLFGHGCGFGVCYRGWVCCVDFFGFVVLQLICDFLVFGFISLDLVVCCDFWFVALSLVFGLVCWVDGGCVCWCRFDVGGYCFDVVFGSAIVLWLFGCLWFTLVLIVFNNVVVVASLCWFGGLLANVNCLFGADRIA